jgi:hypothetical protein
MLIRIAILILVNAVLVSTFISCGDDDKPTPPVVRFQTASQTIGEGAGTIDVNLLLDKPAPANITLRYSLSGTAIEGTTTSADYRVVGKFGEVVILAGEASGAIKLEIKQDNLVEGNETIIITLDEVVGKTATIGSPNVTTITIEDDDLGSKVSFASATRTVKESDGPIEIELTLDNPAPQDLTVTYEFNYDLPNGVFPAYDSLFIHNYAISIGINPELLREFHDFYVDGEYGVVSIPVGETSAKITLVLYSDFQFENNETIEINLKSVSQGGQVGTTSKTTITLNQEDGRIIALLWDPSHTNVDLDMFLWVGEEVNSLNTILHIAASPRFTPREEIIFFPKILAEEIDDLAFGLSYIYYEGTANPMNFEAHFIDFTNGAFEPVGDRDIFSASYTLANINPWDTENGTVPKVVQTFKIVNGEHVELSDITVPVEGSRIKKHSIPQNFQKMEKTLHTFGNLKYLFNQRTIKYNRPASR